MPNQNDNRTVPGFTVYHDLNSPTGESYHCHEYHEVIFFLSGEGRYVVEGKTYRLQPGDLLVISDREIHRDSEKSGKRRDRYIAYIDSAFLEEAKKPIATGRIYHGALMCCPAGGTIFCGWGLRRENGRRRFLRPLLKQTLGATARTC